MRSQVLRYTEYRLCTISRRCLGIVLCTMYIQEQFAYMNGGVGASNIRRDSYRREMWKHTVFAIIDILSLFIKGFSGMRASK